MILTLGKPPFPFDLPLPLRCAVSMQDESRLGLTIIQSELTLLSSGSELLPPIKAELPLTASLLRP